MPKHLSYAITRSEIHVHPTNQTKHTKTEIKMLGIYNIDVTRTELSADPVKKMGKVGCQSTVVIAALCGRVLRPFVYPRT
jgi:hypothetical protein